MKSKARYFQLLGFMALTQPLAAVAHPMNWASEPSSFLGGMIHPLTGFDHVITMLVVGFWISQASRYAIRILPFIFISLMLVGCGLTLVPIEIGHAENIMNLSALILGLMLVSGHQVSSLTTALIVGNLALFHGYVHAYDIWMDMGGSVYTAGFASTTLMLISMGIAMRAVANRFMCKSSVHLP